MLLSRYLQLLPSLRSFLVADVSTLDWIGLIIELSLRIGHAERSGDHCSSSQLLCIKTNILLMSLLLRVKYVNKLTRLSVSWRTSLIGKVPVAADLRICCIERLRIIVGVMLQIFIFLLDLAPSIIYHTLRPLNESYFGRGFLFQSSFSFSFFLLSLDFFFLANLPGCLFSCRRLIL